MKTTTHDSNENSVLLAFAELDRLERARADFATAKGAARASLDRQADDIHALRARLEAERPFARARVRRANEASRRLRERVTAEALAAAEVGHRERLARYEADLEAKRLQLEVLAARPVAERPSRRLLEWSVPTAATVLVAFLGFTLLGEDAAEAADPTVLIAAHEPAMEPEFGPMIPLAEAEAEPEPAPEPVETKRPTNEKPRPKKPGPKADKPVKRPITGNSNPLILKDLDGNPLG